MKVLSAWQFNPWIALAIVGVGLLYEEGVTRARRKRGSSAFPRRREICFMAGLVVTYIALQSPIDRYSSLLLSVHMVQHLLLSMVAAPLFVLGTPVTLALEAASARTRRRVLLPVLRSPVAKVLGSPLFGWVGLAIVMWATHYTSIYQAALQNQTLHALEHLAYLVTAVLFWWPVAGLDPNPARISHPARLLYLFLSMPVTALLGLSIYTSTSVLYPHYVEAGRSLGISALSDQHLAGAIMWEVGMFPVILALAMVLLDWMNKDERQALRADERRMRLGAEP